MARSTYNFFEVYPGPHGAHLNCLTAYTRTRSDDERMKGNRSIHPYGSQYVAPKRPSKLRLTRLHSALSAHCERHPNDGQSASHLASVEAALAA